MQEKKNNTGLIIILMIFILISIVLLGYIAYDKGLIFSKDVKQTDNVKENETNKEAELADEYVKNDIENKINNIVTFGRASSTKANEQYFNMDGINNSTLLNLSNENKAFIVLNSLSGQYNNLSTDQRTIALDELKTNNQAADNALLDILTVVPSSLVEQEYKKYFGSEINNISLKASTMCPNYIYGDSSKTYYRLSECGGTAYAVILVYTNKYTKKNDEIYAYTNLGAIHPDYDNQIDGKVYKDIMSYEESEALKSEKLYKSNMSFEDSSKFKIDESNYKDFQEYKFTFTKGENGIYHFTKVEKVEK